MKVLWPGVWLKVRTYRIHSLTESFPIPCCQIFLSRVYVKGWSPYEVISQYYMDSWTERIDSSYLDAALCSGAGYMMTAVFTWLENIHISVQIILDEPFLIPFTPNGFYSITSARLHQRFTPDQVVKPLLLSCSCYLASCLFVISLPTYHLLRPFMFCSKISFKLFLFFPLLPILYSKYHFSSFNHIQNTYELQSYFCFHQLRTTRFIRRPFHHLGIPQKLWAQQL